MRLLNIQALYWLSPGSFFEGSTYCFANFFRYVNFSIVLAETGFFLGGGGEQADSVGRPLPLCKRKLSVCRIMKRLKDWKA